MTRYYVERSETYWVDAESEEEAIQVCKDGGGSGGTVDWWADEGTLYILPDDPGPQLTLVPRD